MRGCERLANGEPISAIFLTEHMRESEVPTHCYRCGKRIRGEINWQYVGGHGDMPFCLECLTENSKE